MVITSSLLKPNRSEIRFKISYTIKKSATAASVITTKTSEGTVEKIFSINALENNIQKQIIISAEAKENRVFIKIADNGKGIEKEIEDKRRQDEERQKQQEIIKARAIYFGFGPPKPPRKGIICTPRSLIL